MRLYSIQVVFYGGHLPFRSSSFEAVSSCGCLLMPSSLEVSPQVRGSSEKLYPPTRMQWGQVAMILSKIIKRSFLSVYARPGASPIQAQFQDFQAEAWCWPPLLEGQCLTEEQVYQVTVERPDKLHVERYIGLTGGTFKQASLRWFSACRLPYFNEVCFWIIFLTNTWVILGTETMKNQQFWANTFVWKKRT